MKRRHISEGTSKRLFFLRPYYATAASKREPCLKLHAYRLWGLLILKVWIRKMQWKMKAGGERICLHFESTQMLKVHEVKWQNGIPLCIYICICIQYYFWVNCELEYVRRIIKQSQKVDISYPKIQGMETKMEPLARKMRIC